MTSNGVRTCTFGHNNLGPYKYRLARGIHFLRAGALAAAGASSLEAFGKGRVSRDRLLLLVIEILTQVGGEVNRGFLLVLKQKPLLQQRVVAFVCRSFLRSNLVKRCSL